MQNIFMNNNAWLFSVFLIQLERELVSLDAGDSLPFQVTRGRSLPLQPLGWGCDGWRLGGGTAASPSFHHWLIVDCEWWTAKKLTNCLTCNYLHIGWLSVVWDVGPWVLGGNCWIIKPQTAGWRRCWSERISEYPKSQAQNDDFCRKRICPDTFWKRRVIMRCGMLWVFASFAILSFVGCEENARHAILQWHIVLAPCYSRRCWIGYRMVVVQQSRN